MYTNGSFAAGVPRLLEGVNWIEVNRLVLPLARLPEGRPGAAGSVFLPWEAVVFPLPFLKYLWNCWLILYPEVSHKWCDFPRSLIYFGTRPEIPQMHCFHYYASFCWQTLLSIVYLVYWILIATDVSYCIGISLIQNLLRAQWHFSCENITLPVLPYN